MIEHLEEQLVNELRALIKPINEKYKDYFHIQLLTLVNMGDMSCEACKTNEIKCQCKRAMFGYEDK